MKNIIKIKVFIVMTVILICTSYGVVFAQVPLAEDDNSYKTNTRVNFRQEPNLESDIYETLNPGVGVMVISLNSDGWIKVKHEENTGYIKSEYLTDMSNVSSSSGEVELLQWSEAKNYFTTYTPAKIYDVRTGQTYYVQSFSNGLHADVETLTKEDTNILLNTYGGRWKWDPRPVLVTINGRTMAASINGMPHGGGTISNNGMNGQVCIHFKGSTTHNGNQAFTRDHQVAIDEAWSSIS